ncbi:hypothetical protein IMCC3135_09045 [Granulosicoccus antarcticus IMCC3135]|uniref:Uncharacterized protein n=1 Tax=Granulosicoccus antarcticus IMCC3135 TaxID=1192854 RepID=A0A2Z2NKS2_9GAMM|nr:hypothetical protein IMCC3135_09045 [Granulosicoccus antarcticus IMCC3135]
MIDPVTAAIPDNYTAPALVTWDALTLSNAIHDRDVSCREVMNTYLDHLNSPLPEEKRILFLFAHS